MLMFNFDGRVINTDEFKDVSIFFGTSEEFADLVYEYEPNSIHLIPTMSKSPKWYAYNERTNRFEEIGEGIINAISNTIRERGSLSVLHNDYY